MKCRSDKVMQLEAHIVACDRGLAKLSEQIGGKESPLWRMFVAQKQCYRELLNAELARIRKAEASA